MRASFLVSFILVTGCSPTYTERYWSVAEYTLDGKSNLDPQKVVRTNWDEETEYEPIVFKKTWFCAEMWKHWSYFRGTPEDDYYEMGVVTGHRLRRLVYPLEGYSNSPSDVLTWRLCVTMEPSHKYPY